MKKSHLIGIAIIAIAIGLLLSLSGDVSTYSTFSQAMKSGERVKLVGQLMKDKPVEYDPAIDPNKFSFHIKDSKGVPGRVTLLTEKPQEFERSESIVLTGAMEGDVFVATEMLMKCPSKYKDEEIIIRSKSKQI